MSDPGKGAGPFRIRPVGRRAVLVEVGSLDEVHCLWAAFSVSAPPGVAEVVPGDRSLMLRLGTEGADLDEITRALQDSVRSARSMARSAARLIRIPVCYDGPDLDSVAGDLGLDADEVGRLHASTTYTVGFLGFSPGFAYLFGAPPELSLPRRATPRTSVPAGSVALAAGMTTVYPQATPGGWHLIGRTSEVMFDPRERPPARLSPGDRVRFDPVDGPMPPHAVELTTAIARPSPGQGALQVIDPGPLLTIQDRGRPGWSEAGVPTAGAADIGSAVVANRLVGNPDGHAVLEATHGLCRLRLAADRLVAVTGAAVSLTVNGLPALTRTALPLPAGADIGIGPTRSGVRVYVAVAGGIDVAEVLGSRSTDTLSGLGPRRLRAGDVLALGAVRGGSVDGLGAARPTRDGGATAEPLEVKGLWGPRDDRLSPAGRAVVEGAEFTVSASSDRTGIRLEGPQVELTGSGDVPSEAMVAGALQIPPGGHPIILMRNHPTTGGYPVAAVVDDDGVDLLAQAPAGSRVRFRLS